ncbi:uncharacterized protein METZ01_LOCUS226592, partial [marine metagenome]
MAKFISLKKKYIGESFNGRTADS